MVQVLIVPDLVDTIRPPMDSSIAGRVLQTDHDKADNFAIWIAIDPCNSSTYGVNMIKKAWAVWKGGIKDGIGSISTETGVLNEAPYGFKARFENGKGTNPEELIGAAHAGCFSMAFSLMLGEAGLTADKIET
ncbi:MAG: OsmC family peroxiredoxin, partial [Betaproteobacteria bacterium]